MHQQADQRAQRQQRGQHVGHQLGGNALLDSKTFAHLHTQHLWRTCFAIGHVQRDDAQGLAVLFGLVKQGLAWQQTGLLRRRWQLAVTQQKLARRGRDHVGDAVVGVLLQHVLGGAGKVDQQA